MIPLPWHLESWNVGTCLYMIWAGLQSLIMGINSIIWRSNVINSAPVWCDITTRFIVGASVAIPACSLCINRRLYHIASISSVTKTKADKRRDIMIDLAIGLGLPILQIILYYIPQGHRFNILEEVGCWPTVYNTPVAFALVYTWPLIIGCVSAYYSIYSIIYFARSRAQFIELLSMNKNLNSSRYLRLMGLAGIELLCTIPLSSYYIYLDVTEGIYPWQSWENTHLEFSNVGQFPSIVWRGSTETVTETTIWFTVVCPFIFFAFFGFAAEARKNYHLAYLSIAKRLRRSTGNVSSGGSWTKNGSIPDMASKSGSNNMPAFISQRTQQKHDSLTSFSTTPSIAKHNITFDEINTPSIAKHGIAFDDVKETRYSQTETATGSISKESLPNLHVDRQVVPLPEIPTLGQPESGLETV